MGLEELQQLTREIQDSVMAIRAQPVKPVFQRMSRIVREVADMVGKSIRLVTEGENTEVDKTVIDKLASRDHNDPKRRRPRHRKPEKACGRGKEPEGTIKLTAKHRSGRIVIEIVDDGAGINRERVRQKAIDNELIAADANLTDEEIDNLIFAPGFSTADKISDISGVWRRYGRGQAFDPGTRRSYLDHLASGPRFDLHHEPSADARRSDGMVVTVAGQTLVVPLTAIVETLQRKRRTSTPSVPTSADLDPQSFCHGGCRRI